MNLKFWGFIFLSISVFAHAEEYSVKKIARVCSRALGWYEILQKNVTPEKRVQLWRKIDQPTPGLPTAPDLLNPEALSARYKKVISEAPPIFFKILTKKGKFPRTLPEDISMDDALPIFREMATIYNRASRWLVLFPLRNKPDFSKALKDIRPYSDPKRFKINVQNATAQLSKSADGHYSITIPTFGISKEDFEWMKTEIAKAWHFPDLTVSISALEKDDPEALHLVAMKGVPPHADGMGGSKIFLDPNYPRGSEYSQVAIQHEFGHILGFPDCYVEFWDEELHTFVYYVLDPLNRMCNLAGSTSSLHRDALVEAYFGR